MIRLLPLLVLLLLSACSGVPQRPQPLDPELAWQQHQQQLQTLDSWGLSGRLAIQSGDEGWHLSVNWQQQQEHYTINIIAPLGQGSMRLQGSAQQVTLQTSEGEAISASDPDLLLYQELGWKVPVAALRYWVLGLPAPGAAERTLDAYGRLSTLAQAGWNIEFQDYEARDGIELPRKVFVRNHRAQVKLVVGEWHTPLPGNGEGG